VLVDRKKLHFTFVTIIIGFMLAIQFQTTQQPAVRDTRDMWELREDLKKEQELHAQLLYEIRKYEDTLESYEQKRADSKGAILRQTLNELKKEAGLTEVVGPGVVLTIQPLYDETYVGPIAETVSPELLKRLVNELNMYGAEEISIAGQRVINTTVIRDINGITKIDGYKLNSFPFEIKVIAEDAEKLYNRLKASTLMEDFVVEDLQLIVSEPLNRLVIPPYDGSLRIQHMEAVKEKGGS
jgi:uncharacterized protein YlxW (UPF0749 family)